jgi:cystine transport system ATP-binding protein
MGDDAAVVEVQGLVVRRGGRPVVDHVALTVTAGSPFAIVGRSGSGKTTLLLALAGLLVPEEGVIRIASTPLAELAPRARAQRVGMVFQDHQLFPHLSARANVSLAPRLAGRRDADDQATALLAELGLAGLEERRPHELSGGQRQRVAIARSLALQPRLILFDEPSAALDPRTTRDFAALLGRLVERTQVIIVSHDLPFVEQCCDRGIRMEGGRVAAEGALAEIVER